MPPQFPRTRPGDGWVEKLGRLCRRVGGPTQRRNADQAWGAVGLTRPALSPAASQLVPTPPIPSHPPSPTLPPCPPTRARPRLAFARRFVGPAQGRACPCEGRGTSLPVRGGVPFWQGVWGMCPQFPRTRPGDGWVEKLGRLCRRVGGPNQRRNADPTLPLPPASCGCRACPAFVSLCRFRAILHRGPRPSFGPRLGRYDLFPFFDRFNTPQRGPRPLIHPVPGRYDSSPFVDLSAAPQSQAARRPSKQRQPEKRVQTIQCKSTPPLPCSLHPHDALPHRSPAIIAFLAHHKDPQPRRWDR